MPNPDSDVTAGLDGVVGDAAGDVAGERSRAARLLGFLPLGLMAAIAFATFAVILWTLRRGFGWGDEAFVYTMIASNRIATDVPLGFQHLLHPLYVLTGESVLVFRVVRLAGYVLLGVALVWAARSVLRRAGISIPRSGWVFILIFAQVGTFLAWSYPPRYISYNELASWFAQLGAALILLSLSWGLSSPGDRRASRMLWLIWAGLGGLTTLLVFAKVTSAIAFAAVLLFVLLIPNPNLRLWKRVVSLGAGTLAALLLLWVTGSPIGPYLRNVSTLFFDPSARDSFGHPISKIIQNYAESLVVTGLAVVPVLLIFALAAATLRRRAGATDRGGWLGAGWLTWVLGVLLIVALAVLPRANAFSYLGELVVFIGAAGLIGLAVLGVDRELGVDRAAIRRSGASRSFSVAAGGAVVVAVPFISALGTSNGELAGQFVYTATLWAVLLGIALVLLAQRATLLRSSARSVPALIGCVVMLLAAFAVKADIAKPYGTTRLLSQTTSTSSAAPEFRGLLLTRVDAAWVNVISAAGDTLGARDVPATATSTAGVLFAFNHSGYANPWVGSSQPAAYNSLATACRKNPPADFFVLQPGISSEHSAQIRRLTKSLARCGIRFPGDFQVVARDRSIDAAHELVIWRLKSPAAGSGR